MIAIHALWKGRAAIGLEKDALHQGGRHDPRHAQVIRVAPVATQSTLPKTARMRGSSTPRKSSSS